MQPIWKIQYVPDVWKDEADFHGKDDEELMRGRAWVNLEPTSTRQTTFIGYNDAVSALKKIRRDVPYYYYRLKKEIYKPKV